MDLVKTVRFNIVTDPGDSRAKLDAIDLKAKELGRLHPEIKVKVDASAAALKLKVLRHELANTATQTDTVIGKMRNLGKSLDQALPRFSGLVAAGLSLGPALLPVLAAATAAVLGLGAALAGAGAALGLFGAAAVSNLSELNKQLVKVQAANKTAAIAEQTAAGKRTAAQKQAIANAKEMTAAFQKEFGAEAGALEKLKGAWLKFSTQPVVRDTITQVIRLLTAALPHLTPLLKLGAIAVSAFASVLGGFVVSGGLDKLVATLVKFGRIGLVGLLAVLHNLGAAFAALGEGAGRFAQGAVNGLVGLSKAFADWATNKGPGALTGLMTTIRQLGPGVGKLLSNLAAILPALAKGLFPLAPLTLALSTALAGIIAALPPAVVTALAVAFLSLYGTIKLITVATKVWEGVQVLLNVVLTANPIGIVIVAIGALVAAIIYAYTHFKGFRDLVQGIWSWIKSHWPLLVVIIGGPIGAVALVIIKHWKAISAAAKAAWDFIKAGFRGLVLSILDRFGQIVHAAAWAFGWIPGLGGKLKGAAAAFDRFRDRVNKSLGGVNGRTVHVGVAFSAAQSGHQGPSLSHNAAGGRIRGPGTATSDSIPAWLSDGEYVVKAASVRKYGTRMMDQVNAGKFAGGGPVRGYAAGGLAVHTQFPAQSVVNALVNKAVAAMAKQWAKTVGSGSVVADAMRWIGKIPYVWGGTSVPGGADCSGFVQTIYRRHGISAPRTSEAQGAWVRRTPPIPGGLALYNSPAGGPPPGHVAIVGNNGMVISQGGGLGPQYVPLRSMALMFTGVPPGGFAQGGRVRGYDSGGWLPRGLSLAWNGTGRPEQVIPRTGAAAAPVVLEVRSGGGRFDDMLVEIIRNAVRVRGGGNVQAALGKRH